MSLLLELIFRSRGPLDLRTFRRKCRDPRQVQEDLRAAILRANAETAFGRKHRFAEIRDYEDFCRNVPIATYDYLREYVEASMKGNSAQLTAQSPVLFAETSGTTGRAKYIPVTPASRSAKSQLMRVWLSAVFRDYPQAFSGRVLTFVSPEEEDRTEAGTPIGAESGHGYKNMPGVVRSLYSTPYEVYEIRDSLARYYALLRLAVEQDVSILYTCNPSTVVLLAERLGEFTEELIRDVRDGTLSRRYEIPDSIRAAVLQEAGRGARGSRAAFLEAAAFRGGGKLLPRHVWPQLAVIACWKGGSVGVYLSRFDEFFPTGLPVRDIGYFASEHRGSVPLTDAGADGVLAIPTNFYEFYPVRYDDAGMKLITPTQTDPDLLRADQLEEGREYLVYVTTHAGLYRYDMGDVVKVTGFYEATPCIRFVQKVKGCVSFTGEKLCEEQVVEAVRETFPSDGGHHFIAAIGQMRGGKPCYVFLVEFAEAVSDERGRDLLSRLDAALKERNAEYASKRKDRLDPPVLRLVRKGELYRYRNPKESGQFKILQLRTDWAFAEEFEAEREVSLVPTNGGNEHE